VLGVVPDDAAVADLHPRAESRVTLEHRVTRDVAALTDRHVRADDRVRTDGHVVRQLRRGIDQRGPVDHFSGTTAITPAPGTTGRRNFTLSRDMKYTTLSETSCPSKWLISSIPPTWAIASMISTPGIMGWPGKCPWKNGSLIVTFLMPTIRCCPSTSMMRSTSRKG